MFGYKQLLCIAICFLVIAETKSQDTAYTKHPTPEVLFKQLHSIKDNRQFITAELIRIQGITRIEELLNWVDKAYFNSTLGSDVFLSFNPASSFQQQNFLVFINGVRTELSRINSINMNLLGIPIHEIAFVEIINTPQYFGGQFITQGAINIVTRKDENGLAIKTSNQIAQNNSNGYANNIKTIQTLPTYNQQTTVGYFAKKGHLKVSYQYQDWYAADSSIYNKNLIWNNPYFKQNSNAIRTEAATQWKRLLIEGNYTFSNTSTLTSFPYIHNTLSTYIRYYQTQARTTYTLSKNQIIRTAFTYNNQEYSNTNQSTFQYSKYYLGQIEWFKKDFHFLSKPLNTCISYTTEFYNNGITIDSIWRNKHTLSSEAIMQTSKKVTQKFVIQGKLIDAHKSIYPAVHYSYNKKANLVHSWDFALSYKATPLNEFYNNTWFMDRVYSTYYTTNTKPNNDVTQQLNVNYIKRLDFNGSFKIAALIGWQGTFMNNAYNYIDSPFYFLPHAITGNIQSILFGLNIRYHVLSAYWFDIDFYNYKSSASNNETNDIVLTQPRRKLSISSGIKIGKKTDIGIRFLTISKTQWNKFIVPIKQNTNTTLPAQSFTDLTISRKIFNNHAQITIGAKNIFNQQVVYLPWGANFNARYFATLTIQLQEIGKKTKKP